MKNLKKRSCLICRFPTNADSGYCAKYCSKYSAKYHAMNYRIRQKYEAEAFQPKIPEAPISESDDNSASIHEHLFSASLQLFADSLRRDLTNSIQVEILGNRVIIAE